MTEPFHIRQWSAEDIKWLQSHILLQQAHLLIYVIGLNLQQNVVHLALEGKLVVFLALYTVNNLNQDRSRHNMLCVNLLKSDAGCYVAVMR